MRWEELTTRQIAALPPDTVAVLPLGAIEQHGPHLPLSTDHTAACAAAAAAVAEADVPAVLMPGLAYTKSDEHHAFPGSIWLSWDTLMRTLVDIGSSVAASGVTRLLFVNGHGGNSALGQVANRELRRRFGLRTFFAHLGGVPVDQGGAGLPDELGMGIHGGHSETSLMLHLRPDLVHMDLAVRRIPEHLAAFEKIGFGKAVSFGWLSEDFGPDGHVGDPTGATAEHGKELFAAGVDHLVAVLREAHAFGP